MTTEELARRIRVHCLKMTHRAKGPHVGSCLSCADILAVLYGGGFVGGNVPSRFVMSKGHAAAVLYAVLAETGYFDRDELEGYCQPGSRLIGHASHFVPGVSVSTGSLGHGLPIACGVALANRSVPVYCLLSDGELDEGSNWEAVMFADRMRLSNLTAIVDCNGWQGLRPTISYGMSELRAFGWKVALIEGHDHEEIKSGLRLGRVFPTILIARTTKGKGVSFMEDDNAWHYRAPDGDELRRALAELGEKGEG